MKIGLLGIAKRYGFKTVHDFYKVYAAAKTANTEYHIKADKWEELYGENAQRQAKESVHERLQNRQKKATNFKLQRDNKYKGRGAR